MPLRRNDRHDTDPVESKLISIGHHLVRFTRLKRLMVSEQTLFWEAAEIVWRAKREYRSELKTRRVQRAAITRAKFAICAKIAAKLKDFGR
jgi:predicted metal-dependent hydrolase